MTEDPNQIGKPIPIFRMFDVDKAWAFYVDFLGFDVIFEHRFEDGAPLYMGLRRGGCELHLSEHHGDATPGSSARVETPGLDAYARELQAKDYPYYNPSIQTQPWARDMEVIDPFGNKLIFTDDTSD